MSDDNKMSLDEARDLLDASNVQNEDELDRKFRQRAKSAHPDGGGSEEDFNDIVVARDILRDSIIDAKRTESLARAKEQIENESLLLRVADQRHEYAKKEIQSVIEKNLRVHVSPLRVERNTAISFTALFAMLTAVDKYLYNESLIAEASDYFNDFSQKKIISFTGYLLHLMQTTSPDGSTHYIAADVLLLTLATIVAGGFMVYYTMEASSTEQTIKAFEDAFSSPSECADFLLQLLDGRDVTQDGQRRTFTHNELTDSLIGLTKKKADSKGWERLRDLFATSTGAMPASVEEMCKLVGEFEVVHTLLIRAVEHGLVRRLAPDGSLKVRYELVTGDSTN